MKKLLALFALLPLVVLAKPLDDAGGQQTVTQITSISTGVTLNQTAGLITTVTATTGAAATSTFTVTNSYCKSNSNPIVFIVNYGGTYATNGFPTVNVNNVTDGAFDIKLSNVHASNALNGVVKIGFVL